MFRKISLLNLLNSMAFNLFAFDKCNLMKARTSLPVNNLYNYADISFLNKIKNIENIFINLRTKKVVDYRVGCEIKMII